jgi:hypothetical protein
LAQEFTIKSEAIESKINQLLPTQGGFQPGVDFSASTMVIPIVDLTETAEGSALRQDLQTSLSHATVTAFEANNGTVTVINTTGYFRVLGTARIFGNQTGGFSITDGFTAKEIFEFGCGPTASGHTDINCNIFDFIVKLEAGDSLTATTSALASFVGGTTRQIADLSGNLVNP